MDAKRVQNVLKKLLKQGKVVRISRGRYRHPQKALSKENVRRYLKTLERTCELAIHELMLTEPMVGKEDRSEIEKQIAYFARHLVSVRWELDRGSLDSIHMDERIFKRAQKIHEWSKFVFERSQLKKK